MLGGSESSGPLLGADGLARLSSGDAGKVSTTSGGSGKVDSLVFRICLRLRLYCVQFHTHCLARGDGLQWLGISVIVILLALFPPCQCTSVFFGDKAGL